MIRINSSLKFALIIDKEIDSVVGNIKKQLIKFFKNELLIGKTSFSELEEEFYSQKESILNYKGYLYRNNSNVLIYFDNTGEAYHSLFSNLSKFYKYKIYHCRLTDDDSKYPGYFFELFSDGNSTRLIQCYKDGIQWKFFTKGIPQDFENPKNYKSSLNRNKFNRLILFEYLKELGYSIDDNSFWIPQDDIIYFQRVAQNCI